MKMLYTNLSNGVKMPLLGLGTYLMSKEECKKSTFFALENGYELIDTAQGYKNETAVGEALKESGIDRKNVFLVTKVNFKNYERCYDSVLQSMKDLQVDYIDLVLSHWPFNNYYKAWRDLEKLYKQGYLRAIGVSNFNPDRLVDLINYNEITPHANQIETNLFCQRLPDRPWLEKYKVHQIGYAPLGQNRRNEMFALPLVQELSKKYGKTEAQIMLKFFIDCGMTVIPKSVHENRILENINIFDFSLTKEEILSLQQLDKNTALIGFPENPIRAESAKNW